MDIFIFEELTREQQRIVIGRNLNKENELELYYDDFEQQYILITCIGGGVYGENVLLYKVENMGDDEDYITELKEELKLN